MAELSLVFDWRQDSPTLLRTRFSHGRVQRLKVKDNHRVLNEREHLITTTFDAADWQAGTKALSYFFVRVAAWFAASKGQVPPTFRGASGSPYSTLANGLEKAETNLKPPKWIDGFGFSDDDSLVRECIIVSRKRETRDCEVKLNIECLPPGDVHVFEINSAGAEERIDKPERLEKLAKAIHEQKWGPEFRASNNNSPSMPPRDPAQRQDFLPPCGPYFLGRDDDLCKVKVALGVGRPENDSAANDSAGPLVAVRGWPGIGKTTLCLKLAHETEAQDRFRRIVWLELGNVDARRKTQSLMERMQELGKHLGDDLRDVGAKLPSADPQAAHKLLHECRRRLHGHAQHESLLLILDDVWSVEDVEWFRLVGRRGALLVTTRLPEVAEALDGEGVNVFVLPELKEADALELLDKHAPGVVSAHREECRQLVHSLGCLPLALRVAGCALRREGQNVTSVEKLLTELKEKARILEERLPTDLLSATRNSTVAALLNRSVEVLDRKTQFFFTMLGVIRQDVPAPFKLDMLAACWANRKFKEDRSPEEIADTMVRNGLFERVPHSQGQPTYRMHALLVMLAESQLKRKAV